MELQFIHNHTVYINDIRPCLKTAYTLFGILLNEYSLVKPFARIHPTVIRYVDEIEISMRMLLYRIEFVMTSYDALFLEGKYLPCLTHFRTLILHTLVNN